MKPIELEKLRLLIRSFSIRESDRSVEAATLILAANANRVAFSIRESDRSVEAYLHGLRRFIRTHFQYPRVGSFG